MSKTVSTRLQNDFYEKLLDKCNEKGVTVNEFLKECIKMNFDNSELKSNDISNLDEGKLSAKDLAIILGIK